MWNRPRDIDQILPPCLGSQNHTGGRLVPEWEKTPLLWSTHTPTWIRNPVNSSLPKKGRAIFFKDIFSLTWEPSLRRAEGPGSAITDFPPVKGFQLHSYGFDRWVEAASRKSCLFQGELDSQDWHLWFSTIRPLKELSWKAETESCR